MTLVSFAMHHSPLATLNKIAMHFDRRRGQASGRYHYGLYRRDSMYARKYLMKHYAYVFERWNRAQTIAKNYRFERPKAWSCWLTGRDDAPTMIRTLLDIQESHLPAFDYIVITNKNLEKYVDIPGYIYDKVRNGIITPTHFTDIIRAALLAQYGGLWLDSTVLLSKDIGAEIATFPFYYAKGLDTHFSMYPTCSEVAEWEGYFIAGSKEGMFYNYLFDFFCDYWKHEDSLIQYLLINTIAVLGIQHIIRFRNENELVPINNAQCELLADLLKYGDRSALSMIDESDCHMFKLSRHDHYDESLFASIVKRCKG